MTLKILGPDPRVLGAPGTLRPMVATIFPHEETLVTTLPGVHILQRDALVASVEKTRLEAGQPPLPDIEREALTARAVDLFIREKGIEIRPDPKQMDLAFLADGLLHELIPQHRVRFLLADNVDVHNAIKQAGACWRITPPPLSSEDMIALIQRCRLGIGGAAIYYHSPLTGTRLMTCQAFAELAQLGDKELRDQLIQIQHFSRCFNRHGKPEIDFFIGGRRFRDHLIKIDFSLLESSDLRAAHATLSRKFMSIVPSELRVDNPENAEWQQLMVSELEPLAEDKVLEEKEAGLAPEFYRHVQWLPGGRIENGELIPDPFYDIPADSDDPEVKALRDDKVRGLIFNYVRDYAHLQYINVGRIVESLSLERKKQGRREVYVVELKEQGGDREIVKIIRLQKWDVQGHLDQMKSLQEAMIASEDYTDYVLDRRLGCRRLTMNLAEQLTTNRIREIYRGTQQSWHGKEIWTPYFERDYARGIVTNRLPPDRFQRPGYAQRFGLLLGHAAAPNLIVGRSGDDGRVFFDDGDEVIYEDGKGFPDELVVLHHTGSFADYQGDLAGRAAEYAQPVNDRVAAVPDARAFAESYLVALVSNFEYIQAEYRRQRRAFDTLFRHRPYDTHGSFAFRWACVLKRLDETDAVALGERIRAHINLTGCAGS